MMIAKILCTVQLSLFLLWHSMLQLGVIGQHEKKHAGTTCATQAGALILAFMFFLETGILIFLIA